MSNLKLESTKLADLLNLKKIRNKWGRIGNNTKAYHDTDDKSVIITYHGNLIVLFTYRNGEFVLMLTDAGWSTVTTRTRLNIILRDNNIPYSATQRNYVQELRSKADWADKTDYWDHSGNWYGGQRSATFEYGEDNKWNLRSS